MRLLIVGNLAGQVTATSQIAMRRGAEMIHADGLPSALRVLCAGQEIQLVLIDAALDVAALTAALGAERISVPVVACGVGTDTRAAAAAIRAGAREFPPLPPDAELIGIILAAGTTRSLGISADTPCKTGLVGRTVADVERDLILDTLDHCLGNRTHAANILGISIRTLRNKLRQYTDEGVTVSPPTGPMRSLAMPFDAGVC